MGTLNAILSLLPFLWLSTYSYVTLGSYKPPQYEDGTCRNSENPLIIPIFKARINSQKCYPEGQTLPVNGPIIFKPRSDIFFADPEKPKATFRNKNIQFGYLPIHEDIESIGDLLDLSSDEIGLPPPTAPPRRNPVKLWKIDEVKSFTPPELLPDIVLDPDQKKNTPPNVPNSNYVLDPEQVKLGRFIVVDEPEPPKQEEPIRVVDRRQDSESTPTYKMPSVKAPEVILEDVMPQEDKEPNFMEQLEEIKLAARTTPPTVFEEADVTETDEENVAEPIYEQEPMITTTLAPVTDDVDVVTEIETTTITNMIKKESRQHSKIKTEARKKRKKHNHREKQHTTESPSTFQPTYQPIRERNLIDNVTEDANEGTVLDGLLSHV